MIGSFTYEDVPPSLINALQKYLEQTSSQSSLEGVFWLSIPSCYLSPMQKEHEKECGPYVLPLLLEENRLTIEMLIRSQSTLHCTCLGPASSVIRTYALTWLDEIIPTLGV